MHEGPHQLGLLALMVMVVKKKGGEYSEGMG